MSSAPTIAVADDPIFDGHRCPTGGHPERPERLAAARQGLASAIAHRSATVHTVPVRAAERVELARVHEAVYLDTLEGLRGQERDGYLDADTYHGPGTWPAAWGAAGVAARLAETLLSPAGPRRGVALVRPPGHHATPASGMGFCLLNNVAIAAAAGLAAGAERVAIVDWDVHHGNGTQDAFVSDPRVLFASLHQFPLYPGTGRASEVGIGAGRGGTVNVPLPAGTGPEGWAMGLRELVLPAVRAHDPTLVLVSAGFDAHRRDPLSDMALDSEAFGGLMTALLDALPEGAPVGMFLEGGYDLVALEGATRATVQALLGDRGTLPTDRPRRPAEAAIEEAIAIRSAALRR